jgi:isocitrate dehydrogenase
MVYIAGEEMTKYTCDLIRKEWIDPYWETGQWQHFDLSCKARDETNDQVLRDAVEAGKELGAIFKEPTITPSAVQVKEFGLSQALPSPNGAMRRGWNGITISRDTIHIEGVELGFKRPVLFERHAVGGEYSAGWKSVGRGKLLTTFHPEKGDPVLVDSRDLENDDNVAVVYHNPLDNVTDLAHHFFSRCLEAKVVPYVVTKKTVFKWQEGFWAIHLKVFNDHYKQQYLDAGLLEQTNGELMHLISDAATMQIIRWTGGGFGMSAHNYDGDMLTDEVAQVHRSPGFITSNLIGKREDGTMIKEFEASHGTVSDLYHMMLKGEETSMNPLGMVEAIIGAMQHAAKLQLDKGGSADEHEKVMIWTTMLRKAMHNTFRYGQGTRDLSGPTGFTTEDFIKKVAWRLDRYLVAEEEDHDAPTLNEPSRAFRRNHSVDEKAVDEMFAKYDTDGSGSIDKEEFVKMIVQLGVAPQKAAKEKSAADV